MMASLSVHERMDRRSENAEHADTYKVEDSDAFTTAASLDDNNHANRQSFYEDRSVNDDPNRALLLAAARGGAAGVRTLLAKPGVDGNTKTADGKTALWYFHRHRVSQVTF